MNKQILCDNCILLLVSRMTDLDVMVLSVMANTHPLKGLTLPKLLEELVKHKKNSHFTKNRVYTTLLNMRVRGFPRVYPKESGKLLFYNCGRETGSRTLSVTSGASLRKNSNLNRFFYDCVRRSADLKR